MTMTSVNRRLKGSTARMPTPLRDASYRAWGLAHGQWPTPLADAVQPWLTRNPITFNDKIRHRLAHDRRPILGTFSDKLLARDYAAARIDPDLLLPLLAVGKHATDIDWHTLPRQYACKVNHASGGVIIVTDSADPASQLPADARHIPWRRYLIHPDQAQPARIAALIDHWLSMPYRRHAGAYPEWAYRAVDRHVLVEAYHGSGGSLPASLCMLCNDGELTAIFAFRPDAEVRIGEYRLYLADEAAEAADWAALDAAEWDRLLAASRALSAGIDMLRVDWMVGIEGSRFNELTCYPAGGRGDYGGHDRLSEAEYAAALSRRWHLP
jgi:hypothetical protein